jgi:hypothetical protein
MARRLGNISREAIRLLILFVAQQKPSRGGLWHPILMQFYSGPLMHLLSGVDTMMVRFSNWVSRGSQEGQSTGRDGLRTVQIATGWRFVSRVIRERGTSRSRSGLGECEAKNAE